VHDWRARDFVARSPVCLIAWGSEYVVESAQLSVIVTTYNEGEELHRTLRSVVQNTACLREIIVVDDGSTDGACEAIPPGMARVIRHSNRIGIAYSRDEASKAARGNVFCYLDAHQRLSPGCLDQCAQHALAQRSIVSPDIRDFGLFNWRMHGADFELCPKRGYFSARWRQWFQLRRITQVTGLRAPAYLIPSSVYARVGWSPMLRGWGASEASVGVRAFFSGTPIHHLRGPLSRHRFQNSSQFPVSWDEIYRNQAIIARICFDDEAWLNYWLPLLGPHLTAATQAELDSTEMHAEREQFRNHKIRPDREFWTHLLRKSVPSVLGG